MSVVKINNILKQVVAESVKRELKEYICTDDFFNYVVNRFNKEGIEIGDHGDMEELYQGCSNFDFERKPFDELYMAVKRQWLQYKKEQLSE